MFAPGFRLSLFDVVVLVVGVLGAWTLGFESPTAGVVIAFVVGHFFLFCNVFRIERKPELVWAAVFIILTFSTVLTGKPGWPITFILSFLVAVLLVYLELKKPSYHGLFWARINPGLREWWEKRHH